MSIYHVTVLLILFGALMVLYRVIKGPSLLDRLLSVSMVGTKTIVLLALVGFMTGRPDFLDIALVYALINFVAAVAILAYLDRPKDLAEAPSPPTQGEPEDAGEPLP